jgi:2-methylcitrate dehydratase PrpD
LQPWCRWAAHAHAQPLPHDVSARSRPVLLDTIGVVAAGAQEPEMTRIAERLERRVGSGGQGSAVIGMHRRAPGLVAACLDGTAGTMRDLDNLLAAQGAA